MGQPVGVRVSPFAPTIEESEDERSKFKGLRGFGGVGGGPYTAHDGARATADIEREIDARLTKVGQTAKLKGFRPGKVPQRVVRQYYGGQVREEVLNDVIRATYSRAIAEQKLNPAGGPRIEALAGADASRAEHFSYRATFEVYPEIALQSLEQLAIEVPTVEIEEADVDDMIEKLRAQRATWSAWSARRTSAIGSSLISSARSTASRSRAARAKRSRSSSAPARC